MTDIQPALDFIEFGSLLQPSSWRNKGVGQVVMDATKQIRESMKQLKSSDLSNLRIDAIVLGSNAYDKDQKFREMKLKFDAHLNAD